MQWSVLDQSPSSAGSAQDVAIRESIVLAQHCDRLGYERYWVSEHHNSASIVGTAPEVLIAAIAATTRRIRCGSAGVMLPHYSALKVAEQFRVLEAIAPGRIDLGVGRAPGSDGLTAHALNPYANAADEFPRQVQELQHWVSGIPLPADHPYRSIMAQPSGATSPQLWILGSSDTVHSLLRISACRMHSRIFSAREPASNRRSACTDATIVPPNAIRLRRQPSAFGRSPRIPRAKRGAWQ